MATTAANKSDGFEWRALLGPTHDWRVPELELRPEQSGAEERCELCGEPIDQDKPFVTNSAGKQPMHTSCPGGELSPGTDKVGVDTTALRQSASNC